MLELNMKDFVIELEENAKDSLIHGIVHYQDDLQLKNKKSSYRSHLKFSILSIFHAIELFLKARLVKAHPLLIYEKPEEVGDDSRTVNFQSLIRRLKNLGVELTEYEGTLKNLQKIRNRIEHHRIEISSTEVEDYIAKSIQFLESFLFKELQINLKNMLDRIDEEIYKDIAHCLNSYDARLVSALERVKAYAYQDEDYEIIDCEYCRQKTLVSPNPETLEGNAYCFFCNESSFIVDCGRCNCPVFYNPDEREKAPALCEDCDGYLAHNFEKY
jgi:hypothetical protein